MLGVKEYIYNILSADATIITTYGASVFAGGVDKIESYPCVTIEEVTTFTRFIPVNVREVTMSITAWSENSNLEAEQLYEQIRTDLNLIQANTPLSQKIYETIEESTHESYDSDRRLWRKVIDIRFWVK